MEEIEVIYEQLPLPPQPNKISYSLPYNLCYLQNIILKFLHVLSLQKSLLSSRLQLFVSSCYDAEEKEFPQQEIVKIH